MPQTILLIKSIFAAIFAKITSLVSPTFLGAFFMGFLGVPFIKALCYAIIIRLFTILLDKQFKFVALKIKSYLLMFRSWIKAKINTIKAFRKKK